MAVALQDVTFSYDGVKRVLDGFSLTFPERGAVCLSGPSGCGKTTLLRLLAGLETPQSGTVSGLDGMRTAVVFQERRLLPWMSALDNVSVVAAGKDGRAEAAKWLDRVGLSEEKDKRPGELSGGMKQRIALARALAAPADLLILDEPFAGLDEQLWKTVAREIRAAYENKLMILVTHITGQAESLNAPVWEFTGPPLKQK